MKLIMELKSDALPGSGEGLTGIIDTDINYDDYGIPYIPAKRVKGILKESAEELKDAMDLSGVDILSTEVGTIFGEPGNEKGTELKISDGRLDNYELMKKLLHFTGTDKKDGLSHVFNKEIILDHFTYLRSQTTIEEHGAAKENSLRTFRVLKKGTRFHFDVELPGKYHEDLKKICGVTRRFGISRTRGLGDIKLSVDNSKKVHDEPVNDKPSNLQFSDDQYCRIILSIKNLGQLLVTKQIGKTQSGEKYIPGDVILGALASTYIKNNQLKLPHEYANFQDIFIKGNVTFSNAYPEDENGVIYYPAPLSMVKEKDRENYYNIARDQDCKKIKENEIETKGGAGEFVAIEHDIMESISVETEMEYHHSRPSDKSIGHAREEEGEFFQFSVIKAGRTFQSEITGKFKYLKQIKDILKQQYLFYMGKSGTAQYGKCVVKIKDILPIKKQGSLWEKTESIVLTLVSDTILLNEYGFMVPNPMLLIKEMAEKLGVDQNKLEIEKKFLKFNRIGGFLSVWKMPKIQQTALKAGSVMIIKNNSDTDLELDKIIDHSFGLNTEQGYGQVKINWHGKTDGEIIVKNQPAEIPASPKKGEFSSLKDFIQSILFKRIELLLKAESVKESQGVGKIPSGSFLGKILLFLNQSSSFEEFMEPITQLRDRGKKQLELLEKGLKMKANKISKETIETFITPIYNKIFPNSDLKNILLQSAAIEEHFFKEEEKNLFSLYETYAGFFLNQLKLKKRRENE